MSLDLSYESPPPPADLADRAQRRGRRLRRTRRAGGASALAAATALTVIGLSDGAPTPPERIAAPPGPSAPAPAPGSLSDLPGWVPGTPPAAPERDTVLPGDLTAEQARGLGARGQVHLVQDDQRGSRVYALVRASDGLLCLALNSPDESSDPDDPMPRISMCTEELSRPGDGFARAMTFAGNGSPANWIAFGLFAGPANRIVVDHPKGSVDATIVDVAGLGTLYWAVTPATISYPASTTEARDGYATSARDDYDAERVRRTAYRDGTPVFSCLDSVCGASR